MIHEIDAALDSLVRREALEGSGTEVVFDAPTKEWASRRNSPTVDLYLYDIREDAHRRHVGVTNERNDAGVVVARGEPPRYFRLSYLVTAWTQRPQDEHRLLAAMLSCMLRHKTMPTEFLTGSLQGLDLPVLLEVAKAPPDNRQISEVWTALGGELKASLDVVLTAPMTQAPVVVTTPPPSEGLAVSMFGGEGQNDEASHAARPSSNGAAANEQAAAP